MRKSKLESYMDILEVLVNKPLNFDHITRRIDLNSTILLKRLHFLMKNSLVEEQESSKRTMYAITEGGIAVLETLTFQKHLRKIAKKIMPMNELQIVKSA